MLKGGKRPGGCDRILVKEVVKGTPGDAFGELGPAVLPHAAAFRPIIIIADFVKFTA